jgi:hypothetical protein
MNFVFLSNNEDKWTHWDVDTFDFNTKFRIQTSRNPIALVIVNTNKFY